MCLQGDNSEAGMFPLWHQIPLKSKLAGFGYCNCTWMNLADANYLTCIAILHCFFDINLSPTDHCILHWNCAASDSAEDLELSPLVYI